MKCFLALVMVLVGLAIQCPGKEASRDVLPPKAEMVEPELPEWSPPYDTEVIVSEPESPVVSKESALTGCFSALVTLLMVWLRKRYLR